MRTFAAVVSLLGCVAAAQSPQYEELWSKFKADFGKAYEGNGDGSDEESRFKIFKANVDKITEHNAKKLSYWLGINEFADLTAEEFASAYIGGYRPEVGGESGVTRVPFPSFDGKVLDDDVDWVAKGGVTPVKNQQRCGSCWAFSTTGAIEGAYFAASGQLVSLSEEDLVQCDSKGDEGCRGGLMEHAFGWVKENGICSEEDYPYTSGGGVTGKCRDPKCQPVVTVGGFVDVPQGNETALQAAVAQQPVSVAIEADKTAFQLYKGGVFDSEACGKQLDHGVLAVGYGSDGGKDYWKVKNSWGESWGEQGYIRLARGNNMCGIAKQPTYPTGAAAASPGPAPGPGPSPPSPPTGQTHYADPSAGCMSDEEAVRVQGIKGAFCSPECTSADCPSDVPEGVTARPQCALNDPVHHQKRCALMCQHKSECGKAHCHHPQNGVGICTYDAGAAGSAAGLDLGLSAEEQREIVV